MAHDHTVLVLQGGGALGAYQAAVYEGMAEHGVAPDWVAGVSIGAINGALIAGNPVERRLERLREFCDRVSSGLPWNPFAQLAPMRAGLNRFSARRGRHVIRSGERDLRQRPFRCPLEPAACARVSTARNNRSLFDAADA